MKVLATYHEKRTLGQDKVDTAKVMLDGGITQAEIDTLKTDGFTQVFEHFVTLYKPRVPDAEIAVMQASLADYKTAVGAISVLNLATATKTELVAAVSKLTVAVKEPIAIIPEREVLIESSIVAINTTK